MTSKHKMTNGAAFLELGIGNALSAAGWQVIHGGYPAAVHGIDILAFQESSARALALSITLGNSLEDKLRRLLEIRQDLAPLLSEWATQWAVLTTLDESNVLLGDLESCENSGVLVFTGDVVRLLADDLDAFTKAITEDTHGTYYHA